MTASPDPATASRPPAPEPAGTPAACSTGELRGLFLFEKLTDDQLGWLCQNGRVLVFEPGLVYAEGDPALMLYVLMSGTVALERRVGDDVVEVSRTSTPGVFGGAFFSYIGDRMPQVYVNSMRATEQSRFFVLDADAFTQLMTEWFPMAEHLLEGLLFGMRNTEAAIGQRERLLALGSLSAGLMHELNNPAAAAVSATASLRDRVAMMRAKLGVIAAGDFRGPLLAGLVGLQNEAVSRVAKAPALSPLETSDAEDAIADWFDERAIPAAWDLAPVLVQAGLDTDWLDHVAAEVDEHGGDQAALEGAIRWLSSTVETELLMGEITDSVSRISSLVAATRQYSQLDRAPFQRSDVHELLDSTLTMLKAKMPSGIKVVRDYDPSLPVIPAYPAELNQVWTNLIDNALFAMGEAGTLTVRTAMDDDRVLVEIGDTGPGIPQEITERIFQPFFTTKPVGQGTGLGLDISWRIVVGRHHGDLRVTSVPGDTRFRVWLPLTESTPPDQPPSDQPPPA
jgi:signal transduction histidine kinase